MKGPWIIQEFYRRLYEAKRSIEAEAEKDYIRKEGEGGRRWLSPGELKYTLPCLILLT